MRTSGQDLENARRLMLQEKHTALQTQQYGGIWENCFTEADSWCFQIVSRVQRYIQLPPNFCLFLTCFEVALLNLWSFCRPSTGYRQILRTQCQTNIYIYYNYIYICTGASTRLCTWFFPRFCTGFFTRLCSGFLLWAKTWSNTVINTDHSGPHVKGR